MKGGAALTDETRAQQRLWAWQFKNAKTHGIGAVLRQLEAGANVEEAKHAVEATEGEDK